MLLAEPALPRRFMTEPSGMEAVLARIVCDMATREENIQRIDANLVALDEEEAAEQQAIDEIGRRKAAVQKEISELKQQIKKAKTTPVRADNTMSPAAAPDAAPSLRTAALPSERALRHRDRR